MAMTKAEVCRAFRTVMAADYADVPPAETIDHSFSAGFLSAMAKLVAEEKRGSWQLLSRRRRRGLVAAAILAAALLLTACSPKLREAVMEFAVSVYTHFVDYSVSSTYREEIETVYVLDPVPEGFMLVSQNQHDEHIVVTYYENSSGTRLILWQMATAIVSGFTDNEQGEVLIIGEGEDRVLLYFAETMTTVTWIYDGYYMKCSYWGLLDQEQALALTTTLAPMETSQEK